MGISYDPPSRKWKKEYENANLPLLPTETTQTIYVDTQFHYGIRKEVIANISYTPRKWYDRVVINSTSTPESILSQTNAVGWALHPSASIDIRTKLISNQVWYQVHRPIGPGDRYSNWVTPKIEDVRKIDKLYAEENKKTTALNVANQAKNDAYDKTLAIANTTRGGDYVAQRESIRNLPGLDETTKSRLETYYKAFYQTEKLQSWNSALGAKPPYGDFDAAYYKTQNPVAAQQWTSAVANDDIDITQRYGENGFYLQHYTTQGKPTGARGNKAEVTAAANQY
jgi:hypothetical protein